MKFILKVNKTKINKVEIIINNNNIVNNNKINNQNKKI